MHEVVETNRALEEIVDTTHDTEYTEREDPDTDDSDDAGLSTNEPTEETEHGGDDIDNQDGTAELPRWNGRPEWTICTRNENEPVLSEGDLEEENFINDTKVLDDTTVTVTASRVVVDKHGSESDPGTDGKDNTEKNGHSPELWQVPLDWSARVWCVIVSDGKGGNIGEDGNEDDEREIHGLVEDDHPESQEDLEME